jgi:hypothetical protein
MVTDLRGVGKTVLLTTFSDIAESNGSHRTMRSQDQSTSLSLWLA